MKAYHLEKAKSPGDLPEWLFDEHERRVVGGGRDRARQPSSQQRYDDEYDDYEYEERAPPPPRSRGLRDIYDAAANTNAPASQGRRPSAPTLSSRGGMRAEEQAPGQSKATNRLKALRDAKRSANTAAARNDDFAPPSPTYSERPSYGRGGGREEAGYYGSRPTKSDDGRAAPARRVGLPSGPAGRARPGRI